MTPDDLQEILKRKEGLKLEFKSEFKLVPPIDKQTHGYQQWKLFVEGQWHEIIKDILALTNGNSTVADETGVLVIGAGDKQREDGTRELFDVGLLRTVGEAQIRDKVNEFTHPPIPDIQQEFVELDGKTLMVLRIPPTKHLHETTKTLCTTEFESIDPADQSIRFAKGTTYAKGIVFVRRGDQAVPGLDAEREAIRAEKQARRFSVSLAPIELDPFLLHEDAKRRVLDTFVEPRGYAGFQKALQTGQLLWLTGPAGIGKQTCAIHLVVKSSNKQSVYIVRRGTPWDELVRTGVEGAAFVLPDALGNVHFDREDLDADLISLDQLLALGNMVVVTCPDEVFEDAQRQSRLAEWLARHANCRGKLQPSAYPSKARTQMYQKHVSFAFQTARLLTRNQYDSALSLLPDDAIPDNAGPGPSDLQDYRHQFQQQLDRWLPLDIERFVFTGLPSINKSEELADLLRQDTNIAQRMQDWLADLHPDVQAFIITLTVWSGRPDAQIWEAHRKVVEQLSRLNPGLATLPLGLLRKRTAPYVARYGSLTFASPFVKLAVIAEAATSFREYFLEIAPLLREWSIPTLPERRQFASDEECKGAVDRLIAESEDIRNAVADLVGELGKGGIEGVADLLRAWAEHRYARISKTVGIALTRMLDDPVGIQPALELLHTWAREPGDGPAASRRAAAASAIWRLHAAQGSTPYRPALLGLLYDLAHDLHRDVTASAAHSARMISRSAGIGDLSPIMVRLANQQDKYPRQQMAFAINEIAARTRTNANGLVGLLDAWSASTHKHVRWTAMCALLLGDRIPRTERHNLLVRLITEKPALFLDVVVDCLDSRGDRSAEMRETAARSFADLTETPPKGIRPTLVQVLAEWELEQPQPSLVDRVVFLLPRDYQERIRAFLAPLCRQMLLDLASENPKRLLSLLTSMLRPPTSTEATPTASPQGRGDVRQITAGVLVDLLQANEEDQWVVLFREALVEQVIADGSPLPLLSFHDLLPDLARAVFANLVLEVLVRTLDDVAAADDSRFLGMLFSFLDPPCPTAAPPDSVGAGWTLDMRTLTVEAVTSRIQNPLSSIADCLAHALATQIVVDRKPDVLFALRHLIPETHVSIWDNVLRQAVYQLFDLLVTLDVALIPSLFKQFQCEPALVYADQALASVRTAALSEPEGQREQWLSGLEALDQEIDARFDSSHSSDHPTRTFVVPVHDSAYDLRDGIGPYDNPLVEGLVLDLRLRVLGRRLAKANRIQDRATGELLETWLRDSKDQEIVWAVLSRLQEGWGSLLIERLADICILCPSLMGQITVAASSSTARTLLQGLTNEVEKRVAELVTRYTALAGSTQRDFGQVLERELRDPRMRSIVLGALRRMSEPNSAARQVIAEGLARSMMGSADLDLTEMRELSRDIPNVRSLINQAYIVVQRETGIRLQTLFQLCPVLLVDMLIELSRELRTKLTRYVLSSSSLSPDRDRFVKIVARGLVDHNPQDPLVPLNRLFDVDDTRSAQLRKEIMSEMAKLQSGSQAYDLRGVYRS